MKIIGLMGGSGAGKSTVAAILSKYNAFIIDCDKIAHQIMEPNMPAWHKIVEEFGRQILNPNGTINRRSLANIVFNNRQRLKLLEEITHSEIKLQITLLLKKAEALGCKFAVIDAPLLIEANLHTLAHAVWLVTADKALRIKRIVKRDGISSEEAELRLKNQPSSASCCKYANFVLDTTHMTVEDMENEIKRQLTGL